MSTIVAHGADRSRPATVRAAVLLIVALNLAGLPVMMLLPGADETPGSVIVFGIVAVLVTLIGAWSLWQLRRWGAILTFVLTMLNLLSSLPGFFFADSWTQALLAVTTPAQVAVLILIAMGSSRRSYR